MGIGTILDIGASGLNAFGIGLNVVANNIANADTPGYMRRKLVLATQQPPLRIPGGDLGTGVTVSQIVSLRDKNLNANLQERTANLYDYSTRRPLLERIENLFTPDEDYGLAAVLEKFWNAWDDLANSPDGSAQRSAVVEAGQTMTRFFHDIDQDMADLRINLNSQIESALSQINSLTESIAQLNQEISKGTAGDMTASDYEDQRDQLLNNLAEYVGFSYFEDVNGAAHIILDNGTPLVIGPESYSLSMSGSDVIWSGNNLAITSGLSGGKMGAWLELRDAVIPQFEANLDELAKGIITELNKLHATGVGLTAMTQTTGTYGVDDADAALASTASGLDFYDLIQDGYFKVYIYDANGNVISHRIDVTTQTTMNDLAGALNNISGLGATVTTQGKLSLNADSGYSFAFGEVNSDVLAAIGINTFFQGADAESIDVSSFIISNHNHIAVGMVDDKSGEISPGDNTNALDIAGLRDTQVSMTAWSYARNQSASSQTLSNLTLGGFLGRIIGEIGVLSNDNTTNEEFNTTMVNQVNELIGDLGGVNLDEELIDMLKYQRAYQAAARAVTVADELLQILMQI